MSRDSSFPAPAPSGPLSLPIWLVAAHAAAIWAFAGAQPLYEVLRQNPEFFIAHRAGLLDLLVFVLMVSVVVPAGLALAVLAPFRRRPGWRVATAALLAGGLFALLASQLMAHRVALPTAMHALVALAAGAAAAWAYARRPAFRSLMSAATLGVVIFPVVFLAHPSMAAFVETETRDEQAAAQITGDAPPIVFLVFDQLPLTSLMDSRGGIDRDRYPGFAALADRSTWYRNATTVADFTGWALPPIVSGMRPASGKRPTARSYPFNLFTWLGEAYHIEGAEPITQLCPERLCDARQGTRLSRVTGLLADSSVVYLATALPEGPRRLLPPLTNDWKNFIDAEPWQRRWVSEKRHDRRMVPRELIAGISRDDPKPTLYFAHTLLPHEPYVYLRSGQQFTDGEVMVGVRRGGHWSPDPWPATLAYQQHLLQVEFVDTLIGQLLDRLEMEGLLDSALIVVTSDHGVSFRPTGLFKGLEGDTLPDMLPVPLFIKAPGQQQGVVSDRNVQSVDIMPTVASILGVPLTWAPQGQDAGSSSIPPAKKLVHHTNATRQLEVEAAWLAAERDKAVARKVALFGEGPGWRPPAPTPRARALVGRRVADLTVSDGEAQALLEAPQRFRAVALDAPELPLTLSGRLRDAAGLAAEGEIAIAVGGTIVAVSRTFDPGDAPRDSWRAIVDPASLTPGRNAVEVFVVPAEPGQPLLRAYSTGQRPESLNLASRGAQDYYEVVQEGLHPREGSPVPFRWTTGDARITVPIDQPPPRTLRVGLLKTQPGGSPITIAVNDCQVFSGNVKDASWYRVFPLGACPALTGRVTIAVRSPVWRMPENPRPLGVAVETVNLFPHGWPPPDSADAEDMAAIRMVDSSDAPKTAGTTVRIEVANLGARTWLPAVEAPTHDRAVSLAIRWRAVTRGGRPREQRMQLPHAMYPNDRVVIEAPLVPPADLPAEGPWEVTIAPVEHDGSLVADDAHVVFAVQVPQAARR